MNRIRKIAFALSILFVLAATGSGSGGSRLKAILIVPIVGHLDLGFTATQAEVEKKWPGIYRDGIKFLESHPDVTITSDSLLPVEWFRASASKEEWDKFAALVKSGRWELTAGFAHMNTTTLNEEEGRRYFRAAKRIGDYIGVPIKIWHHADVPGLGWNMAEASTDADLAMIVVGANELGGLSPLPKLPRLFSWIAPDGESITVSLHGGSGYLEGGLDLKIHALDGLKERLDKFEAGLAENDYPLDTAMVLFSSGDNRGPESFGQLVEMVNKWNASGGTPRLEISTFARFNDEVRKSGKTLPTVKGDWPATWEALARRSPIGESIARRAKENLLLAEVAVANRDERIDEAWRLILLHDEHSGVGAWPGHLTREEIIEQNRVELSYAVEAEKLSKAILDDAAGAVTDERGAMYIGFGNGAQTLAKTWPSRDIAVGANIRGVGRITTKTPPVVAQQEPTEDDFIEPYWDIEQDGVEVLGLGETKTAIALRALKLDIFDLSLMFGNGDEIAKNMMYFTREFDSPIALVGIWRSGIFISAENIIAKGGYLYPDAGIVFKVGDATLIVTSTDGAPFIIDGNKLKALAFHRDERTILKDGVGAVIESEPGIGKRLEVRYFVSGSSANLPPSVTQLAILGGAKSRSTSYISTDDPRATVAHYGIAQDGHSARIRNVSGDSFETRLRSDVFDARRVEEVNALGASANTGSVVCRDRLKKTTACGSRDAVGVYLKMKPYEAIEFVLPDR